MCGPGLTAGAWTGHLLERSLAAHAARAGRVEAPLARVARQRAGDIDRVGREVVGEPGFAGAIDQALAVEESQCQLLVVAGCAHGDKQRLAVDANLERLLDRDLVALSVPEHGGDHARRERAGAPSLTRCRSGRASG